MDTTRWMLIAIGAIIVGGAIYTVVWNLRRR